MVGARQQQIRSSGGPPPYVAGLPGPSYGRAPNTPKRPSEGITATDSEPATYQALETRIAIETTNLFTKLRDPTLSVEELASMYDKAEDLSVRYDQLNAQIQADEPTVGDLENPAHDLTTALHAYVAFRLGTHTHMLSEVKTATQAMNELGLEDVVEQVRGLAGLVSDNSEVRQAYQAFRDAVQDTGHRLLRNFDTLYRRLEPVEIQVQPTRLMDRIKSACKLVVPERRPDLAAFSHDPNRYNQNIATLNRERPALSRFTMLLNDDGILLDLPGFEGCKPWNIPIAGHGSFERHYPLLEPISEDVELSPAQPTVEHRPLWDSEVFAMLNTAIFSPPQEPEKKEDPAEVTPSVIIARSFRDRNDDDKEPQEEQPQEPLFPFITLPLFPAYQ